MTLTKIFQRFIGKKIEPQPLAIVWKTSSNRLRKHTIRYLMGLLDGEVIPNQNIIWYPPTVLSGATATINTKNMRITNLSVSKCGNFFDSYNSKFFLFDGVVYVSEIMVNIMYDELNMLFNIDKMLFTECLLHCLKRKFSFVGMMPQSITVMPSSVDLLMHLWDLSTPKPAA